MACQLATFPHVGQMYFLHEVEHRFIVDELFSQKLYLQQGITLSPGDTVIDVGANVGTFSLFAAQHTGRRVRVLAFEPIPDTFAVLQRNLALHEIPEDVVEAVPKGLTHLDGAGEATFAVFDHASGWSSMKGEDRAAFFHEQLGDYRAFLQFFRKFDRRVYLLAKVTKALGLAHRVMPWVLGRMLKHREITCQLDTLSNVIEQRHLGRIDLLKVDVEGAEWDVLTGIRDAHWPLIQQVVVEVQFEQDLRDKVANLLRDKGFSRITDVPQRVAKRVTMESIVYARREPAGSNASAGCGETGPAR